MFRINKILEINLFIFKIKIKLIYSTKISTLYIFTTNSSITFLKSQEQNICLIGKLDAVNQADDAELAKYLKKDVAEEGDSYQLSEKYRCSKTFIQLLLWYR